MLFKQTLAEKIINGQKTQTRRLCKDGENWRKASDDGIATVFDKDGRIKWQVGRDYAIQTKRGGKAIGRFRITDIRREIVAQISDDDAKAEGFAGRNEFFGAWDWINGSDTTNQYCWVIEFYTMDIAW